MSYKVFSINRIATVWFINILYILLTDTASRETEYIKKTYGLKYCNCIVN